MARVRHYLPTVIWAILICYATLLPGEDIPKVHIPYLDKIAHFGLFFVFSILSMYSFHKDPNVTFGRKTNIIVFLAGTFFGIIIEFIQLWSGYRSFEIMDMVFDSLGTIFGILAFNNLEYFKNIG